MSIAQIFDENTQGAPMRGWAPRYEQQEQEEKTGQDCSSEVRPIMEMTEVKHSEAFWGVAAADNWF